MKCERALFYRDGPNKQSFAGRW